MFFRTLAVILLILNGTGALYGGGSLILDPSGSLMQMPLDWLSTTPFPDYLIPGIILFLVNGVFNIIAAIVAIRRKKHSPLFIFAAGAMLFGWIVIQIFLIQIFYPPLHVTFGGAGILLMLCGYVLWRRERAGLNRQLAMQAVKDVNNV